MVGHTQRQWEGKFFRCGMRCYFCLVPLTLAEAHKEHLTPQSRGGADTIDNLVPSCANCNQRKGTLTEPEFRAAFSKAFKLISTIDSLSSEMSLESRDERHLAILRHENESVSWAWRHPA